MFDTVRRISLYVAMAQRGGAVHVVTTQRHYKGRVYTTHLLRRSYRDGDKVKNETLGNLSHLPEHVIELVRRALRGEAFTPADERFEIIPSNPHGDVDAVLQAMRRLDFAALLTSRPCREADLVMGMVAASIVAPHTKLATTRWWQTRTLAEDLGIATADEDDLYAALIGCSSARGRSNASSRRAISRTAGSCSTT